MTILANAFSLQMLDLSKATKINIEPVENVTLEEGFVSAIGHADTAAVLSDILGVKVECNRVNVRLTEDDQLIVAQVLGGRLPEGSTCLPEGFEMKFVRVTLLQ